MWKQKTVSEDKLAQSTLHVFQLKLRESPCFLRPHQHRPWRASQTHLQGEKDDGILLHYLLCPSFSFFHLRRERSWHNIWRDKSREWGRGRKRNKHGCILRNGKKKKKRQWERVQESKKETDGERGGVTKLICIMKNQTTEKEVFI